MISTRSFVQEESLQAHLCRDWLVKHHFSGGYAEHLVLAFLSADRQNFDLLIPAVDQMIRISGFECECRPRPNLRWYQVEKK